MCGIAGFNWDDYNLAKKMTDTLKHRGPDGEGHYNDEFITLGHRRLAVLDLTDKGRQPMRYKDYIIVFNGEIYNFLDIKNDLIAEGHQFKSNTDAEVILHAYDKWGYDCVNLFNGMWAFCIYDLKKKELFLSRDRFGVKPLYYYYNKGKFIFSSELKAIKKQALNLRLNEEGINYYFYQKYIGKEMTIYSNCFKLPAGHNLFFNLVDNSSTVYRYYNLSEEVEKHKELPLEHRLELTETMLKDGTLKRLISDVPLGGFLSGGLDSSLITAIIAEKHNHFQTVSIGFKEKTFDEAKFSSIVSDYLGTEHQLEYIDMDDRLIEFIVSNMDEPFGDPSVIPTYLLSKVTKKKVTVALSGDAGDEIFGGYDTYLAYYIAKFIPRFLVGIIASIASRLPADQKKVSLSFKVKRFIRDFGNDVIQRHINWMSTYSDDLRQNLLLNYYRDVVIDKAYSRDLIGIQICDIENYMCEGILKKADFASMLNSLEVRSPFLDYRLVPLVLSLPGNYKIRFFRTKWLLKKIAFKYLPRTIVNRGKRGFSVPIARWIKESAIIKKYIMEERFYSHGFINYNFICELYDDHVMDQKDNSRELWLVFVFNYWYDEVGSKQT